MPLWTAATIARVTADGEAEVASLLKCLIARTSLDIVAATATYVLPADLLSIRRVTWNGKKRQPLPAREYQFINQVTSSGEPIFYIFNQQGRNTIRFHPIPNVTIAAGTELFGADIGTCAIVEYYQLPDGTTTTLAAYIRRRLLKYYVLWKLFAKEGKGQNLKASIRFKKRFDFYMAHFRKIYSQHYTAEVRVLGGANRLDILAPPKLPYTFGESAEF